MRVYIDGVENIRWAIDSNRDNLSSALARLNIERTNSILKADVVHNILWDQLFANRLGRGMLRQISAIRRNLVVSATNFVDLNEPRFFTMEQFHRVNAVASMWIAPGRKQLKIFEDHKVRAEYLPLLVDTKLFRPVRDQLSKAELCSKYNIPYEVVKDRIVLGSFQRDSLGTDLTAPRWQKGTDVLVDIIKVLPKEKYVLFLSSPRRHYLIGECRKHGLPYYYFGKETNEDDLMTNNHEHNVIADLYGLLDIYLISSRLEGGPTAVVEATATKTFVMSTDVGLAADYIESPYVFSDIEKYKQAILDIVVNFKSSAAGMNEAVAKQYDRCLSLSSDEAVDRRLSSIYSRLVE